MARTHSGMTPAQMRDPDYFPGIIAGTPLGIQHVLAMFVSNVTPAIIVAGAAGFGFGSGDISNMIYMIQMSMVFAGIATLIQTIGIGPMGARLPVVQGTSFAFIPIMIPIAIQFGMPALMGGIVIGGIFHFFLGTIIGRIRHWLPPLVTGLIVLMIGLALVKVGIQYAAGGVPLMGKPEYGTLVHWSLALVVIIVTLGLKFFTRGMLSVSAVLLGLLAGYLVALVMGLVSFDNVGRAAWFAAPNPLHFGIEFNAAAIIGMCLMGVISAIETVGDISGITKGGAGRQASDKEITGGTLADGFGTALAGLFGALPNTSFSQNVGLISMTGVMSRHVVTIGAVFLIVCGLVPKFGAIISSMPIAVLGGGVMVMFGMVAAAGVSMLSDVVWDRRNMVIFAIALSVGLGLQLEPGALQHLPATLKVLMSSGLLPAALIAIILNLLIPHEPDDLEESPDMDVATPASTLSGAAIDRNPPGRH
ncbi:MAG: purine permease [Granulosicoccus sp.]|nr:purine permease [Granulosicoccus sp.]